MATIVETLRDFARSAVEKTSDIAKTVSEKAGVAYEIQTLKSQLNDEKVALAKDFENLGSKLYTDLADVKEIPAGYSEMCEVITTRNSKIATLEATIKEKSASLEGKIICPKCGEAIDPEVNFCPKCGVAIEHKPVEEPAKEAAPEEKEPVAKAEPVKEEAPAKEEDPAK